MAQPPDDVGVLARPRRCGLPPWPRIVDVRTVADAPPAREPKPEEPTMRHHATVTTISWIPSEAVGGLNKAMFGTGFVHYDDPPPDVIDDLQEMCGADRFRFANHLAAWIEVDDAGTIVRAEYEGGCVMGATTVAVGGARATFAAVSLPDLRPPVEIVDGSARFVQTVGGHTALPAPRRVNKAPFVQFEAPTVWTTLALTIHADGVLGARTRRREPVPPSLGLRQRQPVGRQGGARRLQGMVASLVRSPHAVG